MSNENKHAKPASRAPVDCPLIGENGNIYNLVGIAAKTLKRNGMSTEATEMTERSSAAAAMRKRSVSSASTSI